MEFDHSFLRKLDLLGSWGVVATDRSLRVTFWNGWLEKYSGTTSAQALGRNLLELYPTLVQRGLDRYFQQVLDGQSFLLSQRLHKFLLPMPPTVNDAGLANMQQTARLVPSLEEDVVHGVLCLIEDVTERVASEDELRQQAVALLEANRHKDDFLAMLAHELRNPLGPTRNAVQILQLIQTNDPSVQKAREIIARQVSHMARLIDDLLDVSRLSLGKVLLRLERVELGRLVRQTAEDYRSILEASGIGLELELCTEGLWVRGDSTRLAQMVGNLIHNAQKFTDVGGKVTVRTSIHGNLAQLSVADTGIGMQPETLTRIFDTFAQADKSLARSRGGLGLGLALVKGLVELHRGTVEASSAGLGLGSEFTIRLPLNAGPVSRPAAIQPVQAASQAHRILVIEDNRDAAESTRMLLTLIGHEVETAHAGEAGLALAKTFLPQVVLCDIGLPGGMSGYDVAKKLRQDPAFKSTYVIALTGYGRDEDHQRTREAGFDLHLIKPVDMATLKRTLASLPRRE
jgi:signal transduction histidine kinase/ActR/RegA family two-component response regulator